MFNKIKDVAIKSKEVFDILKKAVNEVKGGVKGSVLSGNDKAANLLTNINNVSKTVKDVVS